MRIHLFFSYEVIIPLVRRGLGDVLLEMVNILLIHKGRQSQWNIPLAPFTRGTIT